MNLSFAIVIYTEFDNIYKELLILWVLRKQNLGRGSKLDQSRRPLLLLGYYICRPI